MMREGLIDEASHMGQQQAAVLSLMALVQRGYGAADLILAEAGREPVQARLRELRDRTNDTSSMD